MALRPIPTFALGDPSSGYYYDYRDSAPQDPSRGAEALTGDPAGKNPVTIALIGLIAWQRKAENSQQLTVARSVCEWIISDMDQWGRLPYRYPMMHTYSLSPPWYSAIAQGAAASILVRMALNGREPKFGRAALLAVSSLLDDGSDLVAQTPEGPILQEWPTRPLANALNGWIIALWGLYDVMCYATLTRSDEAMRLSTSEEEKLIAAVDQGFDSLDKHLDLYSLPGGWSRYDLYPHVVVNVASPFYHKLHIQQLLATNLLIPNRHFEEVANKWSLALRSPLVWCNALSRKALFRLVKPRRKLFQTIMEPIFGRRTNSKSN